MARLEFKPGAVQAFSIAKTTPLVRNTLKAVAIQGRRNAPGGPYSTGRLEASIGWSMTGRATNVISGEAGSDLLYANSVHGGQPARKIVPVRFRALTFYWRRTGNIETFRSVNHPGTDAQPYMTDALLRVAIPRGFKVVIY